MSADLGGELRWWRLAFGDTWRARRGSIVFYVAAWLLVGWWWDAARLALGIVALVWILINVRRRYRGGLTLADHQRRRDQEAFNARVALIWPELMIRLGCYVAGTGGLRHWPEVVSFQWAPDAVRLNVSLPLGFSREQLTARVDSIAESLGAFRATVQPGTEGVFVDLAFADRLERPFALPVFDTVDLRAIPLGLRDDGALWTLKLGPHTLVAGASGSGKASLVWGLILGLAPAIRSGLVEVHGVDLKSAMELGMGRELLTRFASTAEHAVQLLEDAVTAMRARAEQLAGNTRQHVATAESPHVVVLIDEMAALTAYQSDRELLRRANTAIALLCSQGRAVGYTVFACLQDPRKETLPARGLFTQTIGLRLHDAMETAMVLGEGMRDKGALCHRIPSTMPGVGFIVPDDGTDPVRVRARNVTDEMIRDTAERYPARRFDPIVIPTREAETTAPRPRRTRRTSEGDSNAQVA